MNSWSRRALACIIAAALCLTGPWALADDGEQVKRLVRVEIYSDGQLSYVTDLNYLAGGLLPSSVQDLNTSFQSGSRSYYEYDAAGRVVSYTVYTVFDGVQDPYPFYACDFTYDEEGLLLHTSEGDGYGTQYVYENGRRVSAVIDLPEGSGSESYQYDDAGNLIRMENTGVYHTNETSSVEEYAYDADGRLTGVTYTYNGQLEHAAEVSQDAHYTIFRDRYAIDGSEDLAIYLRDSTDFNLASAIIMGGQATLTYDGPYLAQAETDAERAVFIYETVPAEDAPPSQDAESAWRESLLEFAKSTQGWDEARYDLLWITDDDVPELWVTSFTTAAGGQLAVFDGTQTTWQQTSEVLEYVERSGVYCSLGGHMGFYYDNVRSIEDGQFHVLADGTYGGEYGLPREADTEEQSVNSYNWNGQDISREDYLAALNEYMDLSQAVSAPGRYTYDALVALLQGGGGENIAEPQLFVTAADLNVRAGPGTDQTVLGLLEAGTVYPWRADGAWYEISYHGLTGYVSGDYVLPVTAAQLDARQAGAIYAWDADVRSAPDAGSSLLGHVDSGQMLAFDGLENGWYRVRYVGQTGYVAPDSGAVA